MNHKFGDSIGTFYASSGWSYEAGGSTIIGTPAVLADRVIFTQADGVITCLNVSDGSRVWQYAHAFDASINAGLNDGVAVGGGKVYAAFTTGELKAFDLLRVGRLGQRGAGQERDSPLRARYKNCSPPFSKDEHHKPPQSTSLLA